MGLLLIVFPPLVVDDSLGMNQAGEPVFVQALVPHSSIKALNIGVLVQLAGLD